MNNQDLFGCDVTISNREVLTPWNRTILGFLSHAASTGITLGETIERDAGFAIAHANKGLFSLLLGRRELFDTASRAFQKAKTLDAANPVTERERHYISALGAWLEGQPTRSIREMEKILAKWPQDALAMKLSQAIRFMLGDSTGMRRSLERLMATYQDGHLAQGYFHGCHAFTLEEAGEYALAEASGRKGLELATDDAWGLHAVAHVYDMTARPADGLEWLTGKETAWENCNNFRYHVWWHIALMHLDLGNYDRVLELYDAEIRKDKTDDYRDIANATSVLMRLEFDGIDVGDRWQELSELSSNRTNDNCLAFADLHYMMALCGDKDDKAATRLISGMQSCGEVRHNCEMSAVISHPGLTVATGLEAFRDQNFEQAYNCLSKARPELQNVGGSHAQRDVFERLAIESAIRAGLTPQARALLRQRDLHRGHRDGYSESRWSVLDCGQMKPDIDKYTDIAAMNVA